MSSIAACCPRNLSWAALSWVPASRAKVFAALSSEAVVSQIQWRGTAG